MKLVFDSLYLIITMSRLPRNLFLSPDPNCSHAFSHLEFALHLHRYKVMSQVSVISGSHLSTGTWKARAGHYRKENFMVRVMSSLENGGTKDLHDEYDLVTIGAGSGGVRAARFAAQYGAKVAICELPFDPISSDETGGVGGT